MADTNTTTTVDENTKTEEAVNTEEQQPNVLTLEEPVPFESIADEVFKTSRDFCGIVSEVFKHVFADYEGCTIEGLKNSPDICIVMYFNHKDHIGDTRPCAVSKDNDPQNTQNETLRSLRRYSNLVNNGDRYFVTDATKELLKPFMMNIPSIIKNNGDIIWKNIVSEIADPQSQFSGIRTQYTKLSHISINRIAEFIFGNEVDPETDNLKWEYNVRIASSMYRPNGYFGNTNPNYLLAIERISRNEVDKLSQLMGFANFAQGLNIIR